MKVFLHTALHALACCTLTDSWRITFVPKKEQTRGFLRNLLLPGSWGGILGTVLLLMGNGSGVMGHEAWVMGHEAGKDLELASVACLTCHIVHACFLLRANGTCRCGPFSVPMTFLTALFISNNMIAKWKEADQP